MSSEEADVLSNLMGELIEKTKQGYELQINEMDELQMAELLRDYMLRKRKDQSMKHNQLAKWIFSHRDIENRVVHSPPHFLSDLKIFSLNIELACVQFCALLLSY